MFISLVAAANIVFVVTEISVALERFTPPSPSLAESLAENNTIMHEMIFSDGQRPSEEQLAAVWRNLPLQHLQPVADLLTFAATAASSLVFCTGPDALRLDLLWMSLIYAFGVQREGSETDWDHISAPAVGCSDD